MRTAIGLERLLLSESNVSDLIQFLATEDPQPLSDVLGVDFDDVSRETAMGSNRADLVLNLAGQPVAAIELKVAHSFSEEQRHAYEAWAKESGGPRLVLASLDSAPASLTKDWKHFSLASIFLAWKRSEMPFVADLATRLWEVLQEWSDIMDGVRRPPGQEGSLTFADIKNVALLRVLTRELSEVQRAGGVVSLADVSSGGGNPILKSWTKIEGVAGVWFIADVRFEEDRIHLRFGIDGDPGTAVQVWRVAQVLSNAITVDALIESIESGSGGGGGVGPVPEFEKGGRGRPQARGDWGAGVAAGVRAADTHPGFLRDGFTRLECGGRISKKALNGWSLEILMEAVHVHLNAAWVAVGQKAD